MSAEADNPFERLALEKLTSILGAFKARELLRQICAEQNIELSSAQALYVFAQHLTGRKGFEGAVGAMLGVKAIMLGARPDENQIKRGA